MFDLGSAANGVTRLLNGREAPIDRVQLRQAILDALLGAGFQGARIYERCFDLASSDTPMLVLVAEATVVRSGASPPDSRLGLFVRLDPTAIGQLDTDIETVSVHDAGDFDPRPDWIAELGLGARVWADVNLRVGGEVVGSLAVDWIGSRDALSRVDTILLAAIGLMLAEHLQLRPLSKLHTFRAAISHEPAHTLAPVEPPLEQLLGPGLISIAELMDARFAALFEYHWSTGQLEKRGEFDAARGTVTWQPAVFSTLNESYRLGENLTGHAWLDARYRHIPLFSRLTTHDAGLLEAGSAAAHLREIGSPLFTGLYGRIDGTESRFMIRLMNRQAAPSMPYVGERLLFEALLEELRTEVDKAVAVARTHSLESAAEHAAGISDPSKMVEALGPLLNQEDVTDAVFLCHSTHSDQFSFRGRHGPVTADLGVSPFAEWRREGLYSQAIHAKATINLFEFHATSSRQTATAGLIGTFARLRVPSVLSIRFGAGETQGVLFIPLGEGSRVRRNNLEQDCGVGRLGLLQAIARLVGDVVDGSAARARAEGARRALGVLGHELSTPLARLGSTAELGMTEIRATVAGADQHRGDLTADALRDTLDAVRTAAVGYRERIRMERRSIGAAMSLAPIVAQESSDGRLELQMRSRDLGELVLQAIAQVRLEAKGLVGSGSGKAPPSPAYHFHAGDSILGLGDAVVDEGLIVLAIMNVLRNAYKYSLPAARSGTCDIEITGQRQRGMKLILVQNVGSGIDPDKLDLIFEPWVRLSDGEGIVARPGMGVGLFLSRRIAVAHRGTVMCRESSPMEDRVLRVVDDSRQGADLERMLGAAGLRRRRPEYEDPLSLVPRDSAIARQRHRTVMEIRISDGLEPGPHVHEWFGDHRSGRTRQRR